MMCLFKNKVLASHKNIRLGREILPETNTLAYFVWLEIKFCGINRQKHPVNLLNYTRVQCYKYFSVRSLRIFVISLSVCL
jgi:hypothetical protein